MYTASLGRRGGPLRLNVADGGNALVRIQAMVLMRCPKGPSRRVKIAALSTTNYGKINRNGKFGLQLQKGAVNLRRQQIRLSGTFNVAGLRARGTLRVTGLISASGRCDSRPIAWTARHAPRAMTRPITQQLEVMAGPLSW